MKRRKFIAAATAALLVSPRRSSAQGIMAADGAKTTLPLADPIVDTAGTWPSGPNDPRFANNAAVTGGLPGWSGPGTKVWQNLNVTDTSGNATFCCQNYQVLNCRIVTREGPRAHGSDVLIQDCYIGFGGQPGDHADGLQCYNPAGVNGNFTNIVVRRTRIEATNNTINSCIWCADHSGVDLTLDTVYLSAPDVAWGCLGLANTATDIGVRSLNFNNVLLTPNWHFPGLKGVVKVIQWNNVRGTNGKPVPNPA
jgi:hypothetical protein